MVWFSFLLGKNFLFILHQLVRENSFAWIFRLQFFSVDFWLRFLDAKNFFWEKVLHGMVGALFLASIFFALVLGNYFFGREFFLSKIFVCGVGVFFCRKIFWEKVLCVVKFDGQFFCKIFFLDF